MSALAPDEEPPCAAHAEDLAGWRCDAPACNKLLCGKCTAKFVNQFYCGICGASASQLVVERSARSFATWLVKAITYPARAGLVGLALVAIVLGAVTFGGTRLELGDAKLDVLRGAILLVYGLAVADAAARGNTPERGAPLRLVRGVTATLVVWAPAVVYLWFLGIPVKGLAADHILWLYAALALVYTPIAIATAVTDASYTDAANPFKLADLAWQLGRRYAATFVSVVALAALTLGVQTATAATLHAAITTPVLTDIAAALPMLAAYTATAYLMGLLPFVHGDRFGWGDTSSYADPLHPRMVAEAKRKTVAAADQDAAQAAIAAAALAERNDARKIHDALKDDNLTRALKLYEARATWAETSFDEAKLLVLGKGAARAKRHELARRIFEDCLARKGRQASAALVALAQLHAQQGNDAEAEALYQQIVAEHPNTDAAKIATLKLKG